MSDLTQSSRNLARYIDHTLLKPDATSEEFKNLCREAIDYQFFSVCVPPYYVPLAKKCVGQSGVKVCTVIGFPHGMNTASTKAFESRLAIDQGADELDMVINVSALKNKEFKIVEDDIASVVRTANGKIVKVILETALLTDEEKISACKISEVAGANFVKTSTGFASGGATHADVTLMRANVAPKVQVKASGGIRDYKTALEMIIAGATRLGTSQSIAIVTYDQTMADAAAAAKALKAESAAKLLKPNKSGY